jgi:hypothetical protein
MALWMIGCGVMIFGAPAVSGPAGYVVFAAGSGLLLLAIYLRHHRGWR